MISASPALRMVPAGRREHESRPGWTRIALLHFDLVVPRNYGIDLFSTLRFLASDLRKIALLIQSRQPFDSLLPPEAATLRSWLDLKTVELRGRP